MQEAGDVEPRAGLRRNPKVGAASVEHHLEVLGWRAERNRAVILQITKPATLSRCKKFPLKREEQTLIDGVH